jgi:hypothetical protein
MKKKYAEGGIGFHIELIFETLKEGLPIRV